jgi:single-strand DNA-binding protein
MASFNRATLLGNLTGDVQLTYTPSQTAVAEFGIASNRKWTGQDGKPREAVCFIGVKCYGRQAENCHKFLGKGRAVLVSGPIEYQTWEHDGQKHSKHIIVADTVQFLTPLKNGNGG